MNYVELFAGAGGLSIGLSAAGLTNKGVLEIDKNACKTLRKNTTWNVIEEDITKINSIKDYIGNEEIDLLSGGYPCQAFSYAGKRLGLNDVRGTMFYHFAKVLEELNPKMFLVENVKGLFTHDNGNTFKTMLELYNNLGYNTYYKVLNSYDYEVAQKRERVFIIGVRKTFSTDEFIFPNKLDNHKVLKDALKDVPFSEGYTYNERRKEYLSLIPAGGCYKNLSVEKNIEYFGKLITKGQTGTLRRLSFDKPSPTVLCSPKQNRTDMCHPTELRPLTIRECARIQSFSDNWEFVGSISSQYKQIGNAVPPKLAYEIGKSIKKYLEQY